MFRTSKQHPREGSCVVYSITLEVKGGYTREKKTGGGY